MASGVLRRALTIDVPSWQLPIGKTMNLPPGDTFVLILHQFVFPLLREE